MIVNNYNDRPCNLFNSDISVSTSNTIKGNKKIVEDSKESKNYSLCYITEEYNSADQEEQFTKSSSKYGQTFSNYKWESFKALPIGLARGLLLLDNEVHNIFSENLLIHYNNKKLSLIAALIADYILYRTRYNPDHKSTICSKDIKFFLKMNKNEVFYGLKVLKNAGIISTTRKGNINGINSITLNEERMKEIEPKGVNLEEKEKQEYLNQRSKEIAESIQRIINNQRKIMHIDENKYSF